jgi:hypothetical protein
MGGGVPQDATWYMSALADSNLRPRDEGREEGGGGTGASDPARRATRWAAALGREGGAGRGAGARRHMRGQRAGHPVVLPSTGTWGHGQG